MGFTRRMNCERCGREVETDCLGVREFAYCESIKFDRTSLISLEEQFNLNFQKVLQSDLKPVVKALYMFGSYAMERSQCGDIDYLIIIDEEGLKRQVEGEIDIFRSQFDLLISGGLEQSRSEPVTDDNFWDYQTCSEYPDCLDCHETGWCKLPEEDYYTAPLQTFCLERCDNGDPFPVCLGADCYFLNEEVKNHIFKRLLLMLTAGDIEYREYAPGQKVKVIDIVKKNSVKELIEEFQHMDPERELKIVEIWKK
ncbi:hypothetical protein DSECCO2_50960 [anaerobic digester metagenome]